jgi:exodeoxyribonuclease VII large subunit
VERRRLALVGAGDALRTLSPAATLERGYAVARTQDGRIVHDAATLQPGDPLQVVVAKGSADTRVERTGSEELIG